MNRFSSFKNAYEFSIHEVLKNPHYITAPRGQQIKEQCNVSFEIMNPLLNFFNNDVRTPSRKYLAGEILWYFLGRNDIGFISQFSKFWNNITNPDGTLNSAYGNLIFTEKNDYNISEWCWAQTSLEKDVDSRQAIMHFNKPHHQQPGVKDFPCTLSMQFMIRDNKLNAHVNMRSSDLFFGVPYDIPLFSLFQQNMRINLLKTYPLLELGSLFFNTCSLHIYERNEKELLQSIGYGVKYYEDFIPRMVEPLYGHYAPSPDLELIANGKYEGGDPLKKWIQEKIS